MIDLVTAAAENRALALALARGKRLARQQDKSVLVSLTLLLPDNIDALTIFSAFQSVPSRTFWGKPAEDFWLAGCGIAADLSADGEKSMDEAANRYRKLLNNAVIEAPEVFGTGPIALGGFRYDPLAARSPDWRSFPDARLALPRFLFTRSGGDSWITINTMVFSETDTAAQARAFLAELQALSIVPSQDNCQPAIKRVSQSQERYARYIRKALKEISDGRLTKAVLARRKVLSAEKSFSLDGVLGQLCLHYPECAVFAIDNGESAFFGATPESLVRIEDGKLSLTCLAGSAARGRSQKEDFQLEKELFESQKERQEHAAVVKTVTSLLKEMCSELDWDGKLRILKLENIQHLLTYVTGSLRTDKDIFDIVKRLHPTPAVAGLPTDRAMSFIRENEGDRGWYAGPVGWVNNAGGGEFAVAIRSALLTGKRAILYAGAGIVKGSDPEREIRETELKFKPLMSALCGSK